MQHVVTASVLPKIKEKVAKGSSQIRVARKEMKIRDSKSLRKVRGRRASWKTGCTRTPHRATIVSWQVSYKMNWLYKAAGYATSDVLRTLVQRATRVPCIT